ncbi:receptor activity-modifying protein 2 isoform X2 [Amphiprion ocellaris]|uniref:Receptor (G protein-coupled) activity modifying protein 2 n=1 Tax=Amphiprion ocellaris TaxID=80972 RepID=A0A3Q1CZI6_AMPOC|nr:receptor activity-modifying protein 2 isoform X2 [Amphiprion ocellaris]
MTVTRLVFSGCFAALLIWGCTTVVCLVDEKVTVQPTTTAVYNSTQTMIPDVTGQSSLPFACGNNSHQCVHLCGFCHYNNIPTMECLPSLYDHLCLSKFETAMDSLNSSEWCIWGNVNSLYSNLSHCTEEISDCLLIPWPNPLVEMTFVDIHSRFFQDCPTEELSDPPPAIILALVITPICLIPVMVSLVVLKTKNGDGSS